MSFDKCLLAKCLLANCLLAKWHLAKRSEASFEILKNTKFHYFYELTILSIKQCACWKKVCQLNAYWLNGIWPKDMEPLLKRPKSKV
jgi:hypothetical protein